MRILIITLTVVLITAELVCADRVELKSGGSLTGEVEELRDGREVTYRVTTATGTTVELSREQVARVLESSADDKAYAERASAAPDTVESQLALARWCRQHRLSAEARRHAARVVELDPSNADARRMLNFQQVDGKWQTREQLMAGRGMVWHEGKYRTRQEIALRERDKKFKALEVHWSAEIKKWRRWLGDRRPDRVQDALSNFRKVTDPMAGPPIVELLEEEREPEVRRLLASAAAQINHQATVNALVTLSLKDNDAELRYQCLEALVKSRHGLTTPYVKALRSNDNRVVNRAAEALGAIGDTSAIGPLIEALETEHKKVVGGGGGDTYSFEPTSGGFSFGGGGPKEIKGTVRNHKVLTALVHLSGNENYGYDQALWRKWLATQAKLVQVDLRRDE